MTQEISNNAQNRRIPRFSFLIGIGAIVAYLLGSLPFVVGVMAFKAVQIMNDSSLSAKEQTKILQQLIEKPWVISVALITQCIALFAYVWIVSIVKGSKNPFRDVGARFTKDSPLFFIAGFALQFIGVAFIWPISTLTHEAKQQVVVNAVRDSSGIEFLIFALLVGIIVPFAEEVCFRGMFLRSLPISKHRPFSMEFFNKISPVGAVAITGLVFGLIHLSDPNSLVGIPMLVLMGVFLSALTMYRGRLDASIFVHMGFNSATVLILLISRYAHI